MTTFAAGARTTGGTVTQPLLSVFPSGTVNGFVREIGIFNTTTTAFEVKVSRITAGGTVGALLTAGALDQPNVGASCRAYTTHSAGTPTLVDLGYRTVVPAQAGGGAILVFDPPLFLPATVGTLNGVCVVPDNGAGQVAQTYFKWSE